MTGRVVKGIGGFYFVHDGEKAVMGKARGNLKRGRDLIYVGDIVDYDIDDNDSDNECVINKVIERRTFLTRPPVSNLDMLVVVFSIVSPDVNLPVIDKLTADCIRKGIDPVICISKTDLVSEDKLDKICSVYSDIFPVVCVNNLTGDGISELEGIISGHSAALAGPSGVGKSTITNHIIRDFGHEEAETGTISDKTGRGRHTTRHVEIFPLGGETYLYDTPGFTSLELPEPEVVKIRQYFPEFTKPGELCRYSDCIHVNEPDCGVKEALGQGRISGSRYNSYLQMLEEARKWQK